MGTQASRPLTCNHTFKRGPRKGEVCGRTPIDAEGHCRSCARNYKDPIIALTAQIAKMDLRPRKRKALPKKVREDVWLRHNGEKFTAPCYCCHKDVKITSFHCGHIKAYAQGGTDDVDNLVPLCHGCNLSMGDMNVHEYMTKYYPQHLQN